MRGHAGRLWSKGVAAAVGTCLTWNVSSAEVTSGPSGLTNASTAAFTFAARDGGTGGEQNCTGAGGLGAMQGTALFAAWFADLSMTLRAEAACRRCRLQAHKRPALRVPWPAGAGYNCTLRKLVMPSQLQPVEWNQTSCNGTANYTGLTDGSYEFRVWVRVLACTSQLWHGAVSACMPHAQAVGCLLLPTYILPAPWFAGPAWGQHQPVFRG